MDDLIEFFAPIILASVIVTGLVVGVCYFDTSYRCSTYQEMTGIKTEQRFLTCYVENNNSMIPYDEYVARYTASELISKE